MDRHLNPDKHLTPREAAAEIDTTESVLTEWRDRGYGPPYRELDGKVYYRAADLLAWVAGHQRLPSLLGTQAL